MCGIEFVAVSTELRSERRLFGVLLLLLSFARLLRCWSRLLKMPTCPRHSSQSRADISSLCKILSEDWW
jgi:hypothetical protein